MPLWSIFLAPAASRILNHSRHLFPVLAASASSPIFFFAKWLFIFVPLTFSRAWPPSAGPASGRRADPCALCLRRGLQLRFIIRGARFRPWKYESRHRKVRPLSAVRAQRLAAHHPQLSERPRAVPGLCHAARRPASRAPRGGPPADPRVHRPPARPGAGAQLDCAEARGAAVVVQVLRAR